MDSKDLRAATVIVTGDVINGFEFTGPFESVDAAIEYGQTRIFEGVIGGKVSIGVLKPPIVGDPHPYPTKETE